MNILFDIAHPSDVHTYRHVRKKLISAGHNVLFMARDKDVVMELLDAYGIPYEKGTRAGSGRISIGFELIKWFFKAFRLIKKHEIDLAVSLSSPSTAWAAKVNGIPHIMFNDTESGVAQLIMARPATKTIYTPECLLADWGPKQTRYKSIHDMAYLRPEQFDPGKPELKTPYALIRFVSWNASHDKGVQSTSSEMKKNLCSLLAGHMDIHISAEGPLPSELEQHRLAAPPHRLHNILAHAEIVVGDGATTATEAAVLGTPSVYISHFAPHLGYCRLLGDYGLISAVSEGEDGICEIRRIMENPEPEKREAAVKKLMAETINLTDYIFQEILKLEPLETRPAVL